MQILILIKLIILNMHSLQKRRYGKEYDPFKVNKTNLHKIVRYVNERLPKTVVGFVKLNVKSAETLWREFYKSFSLKYICFRKFWVWRWNNWRGLEFTLTTKRNCGLTKHVDMPQVLVSRNKWFSTNTWRIHRL